MYRAGWSLIKRGQAASKGRWSRLNAFGDHLKCTFPPCTEELGSCAPLAMLQKPDLDYSSTPSDYFWQFYYEYQTDPSLHCFSYGNGWLEESWNYDPLTTLKIVCNMRSDSRTGDSNPRAFYDASLWLFKVEPLTLAYNVRAIAEFGSFKDFPIILERLIHYPPKKAIYKNLKASMKKLKSRLPTETKVLVDRDLLAMITMASKYSIKGKKQFKRFLLFECGMNELFLSLRNDVNILTNSRRTLKLNVLKHKPGYKLLLDQISELFFQTLKADLESLKSGKFYNISQAAKWCPPPRSRLERSTCLCERIARRFFRHGFDGPEYNGIDGYGVRDRLWLWKEVVAPLRRALLLLRDVNVRGTENWWKLPGYDIMYSENLMTSLNKFFIEQEESQIQLVDYFRGKDPGMQKKVVEAFLPHEIIDLLNYEDGYCDAVADLKWESMISELSKQGKFKNSIAVFGSDISLTLSQQIETLDLLLGF